MKVFRPNPTGDPETWAITHFPFSKILQAATHEVPGTRWIAGAYRGSSDAVAAVAVALAGKIPGKIEGLEALARGPSVPFNYVPARKGLRDYQNTGVDFLLARRAAVLADEMGLGKTIQAIVAARAAGGRLLIIAPNSVKGVWWNTIDGGELGKWFPVGGTPFFPAGRRKTSNAPAAQDAGIPDGTDIVVIHYDIVDAWAGALRAWSPRVIILDEAHVLFGADSKRAQAIRLVARGPATRHIWALTGTPMTNRPRDIFGIVETISPGRFGGPDYFLPYGKRYCDGHQEEIAIRGGETKNVWKFGGASHVEELRMRLGHFCLRRTTEEVTLQLPPRSRQVVWMETGKGGADAGPITDPRAIQLALHRATDRKLPGCLEYLDGLVQEGKKVVAFTHRREVAERVLGGVGATRAFLVHGGVPTERRVGVIANAAGACKEVGEGGSVLLACTIDTCGTGINLSWADVAVFVETCYEPYKLLQAEKRVHRFGATRPVTFVYLLGRGTIDEKRTCMVIDKLDTFAKIFGEGGEGLGVGLAGGEKSEDDLINEILAGVT